MSTFRNELTRRDFLATTAAGVALAGCGGETEPVEAPDRAPAAQASKPTPTPKGRVVILGFDGVEPEIVRAMMERGELPNFARLAESGTFARLTSTIPPQSPVAWTSFTTCKNPGGHNIFDFIRRDPASRIGPIPQVGTGEIAHPEFSADGSVSQPAKAATYRKGDSFWQVADAQGLRCKVLNVPFAFPADPIAHGVQLCGLGVPDLRGTTSTSFNLSDSFNDRDATRGFSGGQNIKLTVDGGGNATVAIPGPRDNRYAFHDPKAYTQADLRFTFDRANNRGTVSSDGTRVDLAAGVWSPYIGLPFKMTDSYTAYGLARFFPFEIGEEVRMYMTCVQFHPEHPYTAFTQPAGYSKDLSDRYGLYKTIGWHYDTHALRQDRLHEDAFLADVRESMAWRETLTLDELDRGEFDMLISAWTATDRMGHMFWRFRDPQHPMYDPELAERYGTALEESYRICDGIVGNVMTRLREDDVLMVLSDHGFESWRRGFDVNAWLESAGFLTVDDRAKAKGGFLQGIDWGKTQAYSVGLSSMYLNLRGRERFGTVDPGSAKNVIAELKDKLLPLKDDATGKRVFSNIYTVADFSGEAVENAPDISFGYDNMYQSSKNAAKGAVGSEWFDMNEDKWSGEHASSDVARLPGILFCNRRIEATDPNIIDLGVTTLGYLNADVPGDFEGRDLFA